MKWKVCNSIPSFETISLHRI